MLQAKTVEEYIENSQWKEELSILRELMLKTEMVETVKWGAPHYTINKKNVVGLAGFKDHFAIWFHQGVFLKDELSVLYNAGEGKTKGLRQWRFKNKTDIDKEAILNYAIEAIDNQKRGLEIKPERKQVAMPDELANALGNDKVLKESFDALTPGKRKEYAEHIGSAKQEKTRLSRLEKCIPMIKDRMGLNDKYRNC
ncbi:MAG: YdeI/OmpD-associated family protein [Bacteroidia bacterium]